MPKLNILISAFDSLPSVKGFAHLAARFEERCAVDSAFGVQHDEPGGGRRRHRASLRQGSKAFRVSKRDIAPLFAF